MMAMVGSAVLMAAALALGACATTQGDRAASGAAIGAGAGAFTSERQLDLGEPVWR
jgi:hypothetical protein